MMRIAPLQHARDGYITIIEGDKAGSPTINVEETNAMAPYWIVGWYVNFAYR